VRLFSRSLLSLSACFAPSSCLGSTLPIPSRIRDFQSQRSEVLNYESRGSAIRAYLSSSVLFFPFFLKPSDLSHCTPLLCFVLFYFLTSCALRQIPIFSPLTSPLYLRVCVDVENNSAEPRASQCRSVLFSFKARVSSLRSPLSPISYFFSLKSLSLAPATPFFFFLLQLWTSTGFTQRLRFCFFAGLSPFFVFLSLRVSGPFRFLSSLYPRQLLRRPPLSPCSILRPSPFLPFARRRSSG